MASKKKISQDTDWLEGWTKVIKESARRSDQAVYPLINSVIEDGSNSNPFLNEEVLQESRKDLTLYVLLRTQLGRLDSDIEPVHNPDWCKRRREYEQKKLEACKLTIELLRKELKGLKK